MMCHLHVDMFAQPPKSLIDALRVLGFWDTSFRVPYPDGHDGCVAHWTWKTENATSAHQKWAALSQIIQGAGIPGYIERELIKFDLDEPITVDHPFDPSVERPFMLEKYTLSEGGFKESEVHMTLDKDASDPRVMDYFTSMGMVPAIMPKRHADGSPFDALILTAAGDKREIAHVMKELRDVIPRLGGIKGCSIKFEVMEGHLLFGGFTTARLPLIVRI